MGLTPESIIGNIRGSLSLSALSKTQQRQAHLLRRFVSIFIALIISVYLIFWLLFHNPILFNTLHVFFIFITISILILIYPLTASGKIELSATLFFLTLSSLIHLHVILDFSTYKLFFYSFLLIPIFISWLFFPLKAFFLATAMNIIPIFINLYLQGNPVVEFVPVLYIFFIIGFIYYTGQYYKGIEEDRYLEISDHNSRLEALRKASIHLTSNLDRDTLLQELLQAALSLTPKAYLARIFLFEDGQLGSNVSMDKSGLIENPLPWPRADGSTMRAAMSGEEFIIPNLQKYYKGIYPDSQGALIGLPLEIEDQVVGVMLINYPQPTAFTSEEVTTLRLLSDQASIVLKNAQILESEREQKQISQALAQAAQVLNSSLNLEDTLDEILSQILQMINCDAANIILISEQGTRINRSLGYSDEDIQFMRTVKNPLSLQTNTLATMRKNDEVLIISDTQSSPDWIYENTPAWVRSYAGAPLRSGEHIYGFLNLDSAKVNFFSERSSGVLKVFANHATIAIQNAYAFQSEQEAHSRAETYLDIARSISSTLSIDQVMNTFLKKCGDILPFVTAAIVIYDHDKPRIAAMVGLEKEEASRMSIEGGEQVLHESVMYKRIRESQAPIIVDDTSQEAGWIHSEDVAFIKSWMGVPLIARQKVIGIFSVDGGQVGAFNQDHLHIAEALAAEAAIAIHNAMLYELTQQHAAELEKRVIERTIELQHSNEALEHFVFSITHDLRAPLRAIEGYATALLEDHSSVLPKDGINYISNISSSSRDMDELIQSLLEYSRLSKIELYIQPVDLSILFKEICSQLQNQIETAQAEITIDHPLPTVQAHRYTLWRVVANLIDNAFKFIPPGSKPQVHIYASQDQGTVRLSIEDKGIGIPVDDHQRIFQLFERLHGMEQYPGTGIGLAIVQKSIQRMGGKVGVDSQPGEGSCFWIELPAATKMTEDLANGLLEGEL